MVEAYIFLIGLFFGSFLNVLADRLPFGRTLLGRSNCESCKHVLSWKDLIPVISFTLLRAKCRYCKASLSYGYPFSEIFTGAIFLLTWILSNKWYHQPEMHVIHLVMAGILIVMILSDLRYQILPDEMQIGLFILGIARVFVLQNNGSEITILSTLTLYGWPLVHGFIVMAPLLLVYVLTKGKGMGFGDVKFAYVAGFILGMWNGLAALYLAFIGGGVIGAYLLISKRSKMKSKVAFGPFLILGFYLMLFLDVEVMYWITKIYGF